MPDPAPICISPRDSLGLALEQAVNAHCQNHPSSVHGDCPVCGGSSGWDCRIKELPSPDGDA